MRISDWSSDVCSSDLAGHAHGLDEFIDPPGADPADPRFLDHRNQRFLDHLAGLKEARKIGPSTQLGDFQVQRAYPGIQRTVAIAVAPGRALAAALVAARAVPAIKLGLHAQDREGVVSGKRGSERED